MANSAGERLDSLLSLMARLRGAGGCPWDREPTRASLRAYLLEEAYEVLEAIDEGSNDHLIEELGDLLFQVVFHCQIASERGEFTMAEVLGRLSDKMIRRHPHVFGDRVVADAREALAQWERIKHDEGGRDGRPRSCERSVFKSRRGAWGSIGRTGGRRGRRSARKWPSSRRRSEPRTPAESATRWVMCCSPWSTWRGCAGSTPKVACAKTRLSSPDASERWRRR